ncbi:hypothetical protein TPHA_0I02850 [Tetrapisispora phaffii CBS 4417]|uniref:Uracil permease n=1 Tax=Tetrapisispora phaffii (strain ATCC 24235 / CBS 4417 / NBRC 1672 / NRRL Y-8282 / UCD 70-5) TaxID=1071381 RepID=G8BY08_TETPH|nr:hypothetical protein TPHA_0I02850 [Tetrapisispora phaffii CBS 4417]CCE64786.1 hypothetical protein TPHA_0I02850 [Tetrapisispora phaffii CBS 4417]
MHQFSSDSQSVSSMSKDKATGYSLNKDDDIILTSKSIGDDFITETVSEQESIDKVYDNDASGWFHKAIEYLSVKGPNGEQGIVETYLYNDDLRPVEAERRVWTWRQYIYFWISGSFNVNTWQISATGLQLGLNWWQTWICIWVGYFFVAIFLVAGSRVGNMYHISFPIASRISYGPYFAIWVVLNRVVMACVWFSTLAWLGGECVQLMLRTIFGNDLPQRLGDHIQDPNLNNYQFMCFMLFWIVGLPFLWFPPHKLRHVFAVKAVLAPIAAFAFLIWTLIKADGKLAFGNLTGGSALSKSATAWAVIRSIMSALDNFSTLILNAADFSRFAKSPKSSTYSQFIALPLCYAIISLIGILTTSAAYNMYGINYWSPLDVLDRYLDNFNKGNRAGVFLISFVFAFDQLSSNLAGNAIPAGTDMTALFPKFINIRRGSYICAALALCICPWDLMASSSKFTTALSAYAVFLSAIAGVQFADYFIVRKGYINVYHCYTNRMDSFYMYNKYGTNWRAVVAYIAGIVPNFTGFIGSLEISVPEGAMKVYYLNYFIGYFVSALVYIILVYYFPIKGVPNNAKITDRVWYESWIEVENFTETRASYEKFGDENVEVRQSV